MSLLTLAAGDWGLAVFFWETAKIKNPVNPVNPVLKKTKKLDDFITYFV